MKSKRQILFDGSTKDFGRGMYHSETTIIRKNGIAKEQIINKRLFWGLYKSTAKYIVGEDNSE